MMLFGCFYENVINAGNYVASRVYALHAPVCRRWFALVAKRCHRRDNVCIVGMKVRMAMDTALEVLLMLLQFHVDSSSDVPKVEADSDPPGCNN